MTIYEIRDPDAARHHLLCGLWLSRGAELTAERVSNTLGWASEVVSDGAPLPPLGFVADIGRLCMGAIRNPNPQAVQQIVELDNALVTRYEDYVLGKLHADMTFERGVDAVQRYEGRDRDRAIAYVLNALRRRCGFGGAMLSPAIIKGLADRNPHEVLAESRYAAEDEGWSSDLIEEFEDLIDAVRKTGESLGPEDIFELESGTALAEFGQRVALRQVLKAAAYLENGLPRQRPQPTPRQYSVATNILDEDSYPVGGFTSISNRGTMESLLRSELAYMDDSDESRPDIFDIKYVRDELLYYARDENQFFRRRLSFFFLLFPETVKARFKDGACSWQRIIFVMALLVTAVRKLTDWLSDDAIHFEVLFVTAGANSGEEMENERTLLETLLGDFIEKDLLKIEIVPETEVRDRLESHAKQSMCHVLSIGRSHPLATDLPIASQLQIDEPVPRVQMEDSILDVDDHGDRAWRWVAESLMRFWI